MYRNFNDFQDRVKDELKTINRYLQSLNSKTYKSIENTIIDRLKNEADAKAQALKQEPGENIGAFIQRKNKVKNNYNHKVDSAYIINQIVLRGKNVNLDFGGKKYKSTFIYTNNIKLNAITIYPKILNYINSLLGKEINPVILVPANPKDIFSSYSGNYVLWWIFDFICTEKGKPLDDTFLNDPNIKDATNTPLKDKDPLSYFIATSNVDEIGTLSGSYDLDSALTYSIRGIVGYYYKLHKSRESGYVSDNGKIRLLNKNGQPFKNSREIDEQIQEYTRKRLELEGSKNKGQKEELKKINKVFDKLNQLYQKVRNLELKLNETNGRIANTKTKLQKYREALPKLVLGSSQEKVLKNHITDANTDLLTLQSLASRLEKDIQEALNPTDLVFSMANIMKRIARINNFACTGKWRCPECGAEMKGDYCKSCGYSCK